MANITIKNIPETLHERLKETAARRRRSINSEVIHLLEQSLGTGPVDVDALVGRARVLRERTDLPYLTDADLRAARDEGRA